MTKNIYSLLLASIMLLLSLPAEAGNPDRQGEAGAYELLMNPWARSAGLHTLNTSFISGVEALRLNPAGLSRIMNTEVVVGHTRYLEGTDIKLNAFGLAQKVGSNGVIGVSIMAVDFGEIPVTTTEIPAGTGATFSPNFFNLGLGYAHEFENKVSVGITVRAISETIADVGAFGLAIDAGVQYVAGDKDNFKFGISLRNIGNDMQYEGEGLIIQQDNPDGTFPYQLTYNNRSSSFELPSVLNLGASYDFLFTNMRLTALGNFVSNSFSRDQVGGGLEFAFKEMFMLRAAYRYELDGSGPNADDANLYSGLSAGVSFEVPLKKGSTNKFGVDYAYRHTVAFNGTHNIALRINI